MAQLGWVCVSFWGILYVLWPMVQQLDAGKVSWLPLLDESRPLARGMAILQLVLAVGGLSALVASHLLHDRSLMIMSGLAYAGSTLMPLLMLNLLKD